MRMCLSFIPLHTGRAGWIELDLITDRLLVGRFLGSGSWRQRDSAVQLGG